MRGAESIVEIIRLALPDKLACHAGLAGFFIAPYISALLTPPSLAEHPDEGGGDYSLKPTPTLCAALVALLNISPH